MMMTIHGIVSMKVSPVRSYHAPRGADNDYFYVRDFTFIDEDGDVHTIQAFSHDPNFGEIEEVGNIYPLEG